ncbi:MAG: hypothetical protein IJ784_11860 [Ruminiclostridium sp.]|nr:hypothetical protein [Ruminiclostridium sp.]
MEDGSINQAIMTFFETVFICAVNLYVLISGYFMRNSTKRDLIKPIELLAQLDESFLSSSEKIQS